MTLFSYHSSDLLLIALEAMRLLVQITANNTLYIEIKHKC